MKELNDIIQAYNKAALQNKKTALVTVVRVDGSSYRRPGARMLVAVDGEITGAISGGCLEGDALRKAQFAMFTQKNRLEIYDTSNEDDNKLGVQLGCNGIVYILFEPIDNNNANNPIQLLKKMVHYRKDAVLITLFNPNKKLQQKGTLAFVNEEKSFFKLTEMHSLQQECNDVLLSRSSLIKDYENSCSVLFQFIPPPIQLIIVGAGNDAQPLANIAFLLGWNVIVIDGRPNYATQQRFPTAIKISVAKPSDILSVTDVDKQTAIVLMTHNYNYDLAAIQQLVYTSCEYIGVLGPKKKLQKMLNDIISNGYEIYDNVQRIYGPMGLDIGAETAEEIALSIIAEIKSVYAQRNGTSLKERTSSIHSRL